MLVVLMALNMFVKSSIFLRVYLCFRALVASDIYFLHICISLPLSVFLNAVIMLHIVGSSDCMTVNYKLKFM